MQNTNKRWVKTVRASAIIVAIIAVLAGGAYLAMSLYSSSCQATYIKLHGDKAVTKAECG